MKPEKQQKGKSTVKQLREIRDKISIDIMDMSSEQLQNYLERKMKKTLHPNVTWQKRKDIVF